MHLRSLAALFTICLVAGPAWAAAPSGSDTNKDGLPDLWATYDRQGALSVAADDGEHRDGKPHHWRYFRGGRVYRREWDRNFDGRADLRIEESGGRMTQRQSDDNYDGRFERNERFPK